MIITKKQYYTSILEGKGKLSKSERKKIESKLSNSQSLTDVQLVKAYLKTLK